MTKAESLFAAAYIAVLDGLPDVRKGLREKVSGTMWFEMGAFEGDASGGCGHGNILIEASAGEAILNHVEQFIRAELSALGVTEETPQC